MTDWAAHVAREQGRYADGEARLGDAPDLDARQRQLTRMGNAAWGAGLSLLMEGRTVEAGVWLDRAARRYRESIEGAPAGSWGRPIGALKVRLLAGDDAGAEEAARWALGLGAGAAESPIGRYAAALACLVLGDASGARAAAGAIRGREDFPAAVADSLWSLATDDPDGYAGAVRAVLRSFETRDEYLEDVPVADTVLVLQALARRRGLEPPALSSPLLPDR